MSLKSMSWHLVVWIDHEIARLYASTRADIEEIATIHAEDLGRGHIHHHAGSMEGGHSVPDPAFLARVTQAIQGAHEILIVGPSDGRMALRRHMERHAPEAAACIVGVEPLPRSSEREIRRFAHRFFRHHDLMAGTGP